MNWVNYDSVLAQLRGAGLLVDHIGADDIGERRRCRTEIDRERRGWYHLHELRTDADDTMLVGSFGIWQGDDNGAQKISLKGAQLSLDARKALRDRIVADQARARDLRQLEAARAARRATAAWQKLSEEGDSEYLHRKRIHAHGVRFSPSGGMVVPMLDMGGKVHGLQVIYPRGHDKIAKTGRDKDFWPTGAAMQGHCFLIGSPQADGVLLLAEGYATGASLYQALGLPVAVAFAAGNLRPVARALAARYKGLRVLICADDDYLGKCGAASVRPDAAPGGKCGRYTLMSAPNCMHCGQPHLRRNAGVADAAAAALAVDAAWVAPVFDGERPLDRKGPTDFNDLHVAEGLQAVRAQVETRLSVLGWRRPAAAAPATHPGGGGAGEALRAIGDVGELHNRFALIYESPDSVFDAQEHRIVPLSSMRNLCSSRQVHRAWMDSHDKRIVRQREVGFDPSERDPRVLCNLWGGWPTLPQAGVCDKLLELGEYLCSAEQGGGDLWRWMLRWLAYPVQNPGAKMKTALIVHGPQGTGKNVFFEAVMKIYGEYGRVVDQDCIEDKFNDYISRKLFIVADEVVARMELYHSKNKLKGLITGDTIRINPKNLSSYEESNHLNLVFLSNETQPAVLERDDRRHCVIWTPPKWPAEFYDAVLAEIAAGGIAALHDHLLRVDLSGFTVATLPPMTQAKADLIELSLDNSERFYQAWLARWLPLPLCPARTEDLYAAYRQWCTTEGIVKPAQANTFLGNVSKRPGVKKGRPRHYKGHSQVLTVQSAVLYPPGCDVAADMQTLSADLARFQDAAYRYKQPPKDDKPGSWNPGEDEFDGSGAPA